MSFNVDPQLRKSVDSFSWNEQQEINDKLPIHNDDLTAVITEISNKIIAASNIRPNLERLAGRKLSLVDTCYLIIQDQEKKSGSSETLAQIQKASQPEKNILGHVFKKLSLDFVQVKSEDLKACTLLFGIRRISSLAANNIVAVTPQLSQIQELEATLNRLREMRIKYDINCIIPEQRDFLLAIDQEIEEKTELLEGLKLSIGLIEALKLSIG